MMLLHYLMLPTMVKEDKDWQAFKESICNLHDNRKHKVTNSLGVYDAYKFIRKNKWLDLPRPVTEHEFYKIIRTVNNHLAQELLKGHDINLPHRMGRLELRKYDAKIKLVDGKVITNLPIDWDRTLKLWYEDEESYKNKTLVKMEEKEIFKVYYNKHDANFNNKSFFTFNINRELKKDIKRAIKNKQLDAFKL